MDEEMTPEVTTAEEKPAVNVIVARMRAMHPDKAEMPDDEMFGLADAHISKLEDYQNRNTEMNAKLDKIFKLHPELVAIIMDLDEGMELPEAIVRNIDLPETVEGEPDHEKLMNGKAYRESKLAEAEAFSSKLAENKAKSQQALSEFADENNLSEEQAMEFISTVVSPLLDKIATLNFDKSFLDMLYKTVTREQDIKAAEETAELRGKNAKAEEIMKPAPVGDGLPKSESAMVSNDVPVKKMGYIESLKNRS